MEQDILTVAVGGHIDKDDVCAACGSGMVYRVDKDYDERTVLEMFCGNGACRQFLVDMSR